MARKRVTRFEGVGTISPWTKRREESHRRLVIVCRCSQYVKLWLWKIYVFKYNIFRPSDRTTSPKNRNKISHRSTGNVNDATWNSIPPTESRQVENRKHSENPIWNGTRVLCGLRIQWLVITNKTYRHLGDIFIQWWVRWRVAVSSMTWIKNSDRCLSGIFLVKLVNIAEESQIF